jgi:hypothetical protein
MELAFLIPYNPQFFSRVFFTLEFEIVWELNRKL